MARDRHTFMVPDDRDRINALNSSRIFGDYQIEGCQTDRDQLFMSFPRPLPGSTDTLEQVPLRQRDRCWQLLQLVATGDYPARTFLSLVENHVGRRHQSDEYLTKRNRDGARPQ